MIARALRARHNIGLSRYAHRYFQTRYKRLEAFDDAKLRRIIDSSSMASSIMTNSKKSNPKDSCNQQNKDAQKETSKSEIHELNPIHTHCSRNRLLPQSVKSSSENVDSYTQRPLQALATAKASYGKLITAVVTDPQKSLTTLAIALNKITGYNTIEAHKVSVQRLESEVKDARAAVKLAKRQYSDAIEKRSALQREVNELLTRKSSWTPKDVERFTELYRNDHESQRNEISSKAQLENAERLFDSIQLKLGAKILTRYHEEQLWSDKIRKALTWGTWIIMGVNISLFVVATFLVEPWKRKRLVRAFQHEVLLQFGDYTEELHQLSAKVDKLDRTKLIPKTSAAEFGPQVQTLSTAGLTSWDSFRSYFGQFVNALKDPQTKFVISKSDLAVLSGFLVSCSCGLAALLTYTFVK